MRILPVFCNILQAIVFIIYDLTLILILIISYKYTIFQLLSGIKRTVEENIGLVAASVDEEPKMFIDPRST